MHGRVYEDDRLPTVYGPPRHSIYGTPSQMDKYEAIIFCVHAVLKKCSDNDNVCMAFTSAHYTQKQLCLNYIAWVCQYISI